MSELSLEHLRAPVSSDSPSGANLEYDPRFLEMLRLAEGTREQQYGDTIVAAQAPDWRSTGQLASQLATETRDLRLAVVLTESKASHDGLSGLADGLELLRHWTCDLWDSVHPQLDESDGNDPFVRINALARLCETDRLPALISKIPLIEAPPHVTVKLEDMLWSRGERRGRPRRIVPRRWKSKQRC
ncbi:MAG: type VI secretion system ImpA family N-terminal domain-containing protein [Pirellulales bacterium]|nr:type VI secretion system ImpA family N-terminal domain-containing protein [Pirellulales bacterium]